MGTVSAADAALDASSPHPASAQPVTDGRAGPDRHGPVDDAAVGRPAWWIRLLSRLPFALLYLLSDGLALMLRRGVHYRVGTVRANLRRCFPVMAQRGLDRMLDAYYRQLSQVVVEFLKLATISREELCRRVRVLDAEAVRAETSAGRSVLLLAAHQCNWEWALQAVAFSLGVPIDAAYKPLHDARADRELRALRARFGVRLVAAKSLLSEIARRRHEVHAVAVMADQMPVSSATRHWLSFLGCDTAFYPGPAEIARITGYASFFVAMRRTRRGHYEIRFQPICRAHERLEPASFTECYARLVEEQIRAQPAAWTWSHRRWKRA